MRAGIIGLVLLTIGLYFAITKSIPFQDTYQVQAVFQDANLIQLRSPVRISGVDVGRVVDVQRYKNTDMALITMEIDDEGRPIHKDARIKIRPRLFLEGAFFLDLQPGTPSQPELTEDDVIPTTQTSMPVQMDQLLSALQSDVRGDLQQTLQGIGEAFDSQPTAADDAQQDPAVRGLTGAQALNRALVRGPYALRDAAIVLESLRGEQLHDLSRTISGVARASRALADNQDSLRDLLTDFNATMSTTAAHSNDLQRTIQLLGPTARRARQAFAGLERALPPTRRFVNELSASLPELPPTIAAARPWIAQAKPLFGPREFGGLLDELSPATSELAKWGAESKKFVTRIDAFTRCQLDVFLPTIQKRVDDGPLSAGVENYKEFWYAMAGQAAEGQSFDGNGPMLRIQAASGSQTLQSGQTNYSLESYFSNATLPPLRTRPAYPNKVPPLRRDVPCYRNPVPDVNGPASIGPADGSRPGAAAPPSPSPIAEVEQP